MIKCAICNSTKGNEYRHCPKMDNQLICGSEHCKVCEHWRKEEDKGTFWCTYWHGHKDAKEERKNEIAETKKKIAELDKRQADLYHITNEDERRFMNEKLMLSSQTDQWSTPQDFFNKLNKEFNFTLDPCADEFNHKCDLYYTEAQNGLIPKWGGETVFCNPPYGRKIGDWVKKCRDEANKNTTCVMLIPARTDTRWFHD